MSDDGNDPVRGIRLMVDQMVAAEQAGLHFPALMTALALPDICGALSAENGRASGPKAKRWLQEWLPMAGENAEGIYGLRCSLLHQGQAFPHGGHARVVFLLDEAPQIYGPAAVIWREDLGQGFTPMTLSLFLKEVADGVTRWLAAHGDSELVRRNLERFAHLHPGGLPNLLLTDGPVLA